MQITTKARELTIFSTFLEKLISHVMYVSINKLLISCQIALAFCQLKGWKTYSHLKCLHMQNNTMSWTVYFP